MKRKFNVLVGYALLLVAMMALQFSCSSDEEKPDMSLSLSEYYIEVPSSATSKIITVSSNENGEWVIEGESNWVTLSDKTGVNGDRITVSVQASTLRSMRVAEFKVYVKSDPSKIRFITIKQSPIEARPIADPAFKQYLVDMFGSNGDITSAQLFNVKNIDCSNRNIGSLDGIEQCPNLQSLKCNNNNIRNLDLTGNTKLETVNCSDNNLTDIILTGDSLISELNCSNNSLTGLEMSSCVALSKLNCSNNRLTSLVLNQTDAGNKGGYSLSELDCSYNKLGQLDLEFFNDLKKVNCGSNQLTTMSIENCKGLDTLDCHENLLTSLTIDQVSGVLIRCIDCSNNRFVKLDLLPCYSLTKLNATDGNPAHSFVRLNLDLDVQNRFEALGGLTKDDWTLLYRTTNAPF